MFTRRKKVIGSKTAQEDEQGAGSDQGWSWQGPCIFFLMTALMVLSLHSLRSQSTLRLNQQMLQSSSLDRDAMLADAQRLTVELDACKMQLKAAPKPPAATALPKPAPVDPAEIKKRVIQEMREADLQTLQLQWGSPQQDFAYLQFLTDRGEILMKTAPFDVVPHAVNYFLQLVDSGYYNGCHLVRNAPHVIQGNCGNVERDMRPKLPFQDYNETYPHLPYRLGLAGFPAGNDFYFNLIDNTRAHGPGGQGDSSGDANPCLAEVLPDRGRAIIDDIHKTTGNEWLEKEEWVKIFSATVHKTLPPKPQPLEKAASESKPAPAANKP